MPSSPETPTPTPSVTPTPTPQPAELPSYSTLVGTVHLPNVDNQGSIGCCTSEGVTFTQFTVAVSQYLHHLNPEIEWNPSSGDARYIFSPKFTYNYSGAGTEYCYCVLRDSGCLPMSVSICKKSINSNKNFWGGSILNDDQSRSWDVEKGLMLEALRYRLNNFEEIEYGSTNAGQLTTNETGQQLLYKIKAAVAAGNAVAICGWSSYWQTTKVDEDGLGSLAKKDDYVIWNGYKSVSSTSDGNHCVAIIGYDDDITVTKGGVTMKGAFLVRNSWGDWMNDGNIWLMYDACNKVSEFELFNDPYFYVPTVALSVTGMKMVTPISSAMPISSTFTPVGEATVNGQTYPTFNISYGKTFLAYDSEGKLVKATKAGENTIFALIPYESTVQTPNADFKNSYLVYAVNATGDTKYLTSGGNSNNSVPGLTASTDDLKTVCFHISSYKKDKEFTSMLCTRYYNSNTTCYERTGTLYRFSFIYWDRDISVGLPQLSVEAEVTATNRTNLDITLNRTDKNGVKDVFNPSSMDWHISGVFPDLGSSDNNLSFSGKVNPTEAETGFLTFSYSTLCSFNEDFSPEDYLWGVNIKGSGVKVKSLRLIDKDGNTVSEITMPEDTPELVRGEIYEYIFDLGGELRSYFGTGVYKLKNVGTGKILSLSSNNMTFAWDSGKAADADKSKFRIEYNAEKDEYVFWNHEDTYIFDIFEKEVKNDVMVKLNRVNAQRDTQSWNVEVNKDGQIRISLKNYPDFVFGYNGKDFCISTDSSSDNYLWMLETAEETNITTHVTAENGKITVSADAPANYTSGAVQVKIVKDGTVVQTLDAQGDKNGFTATATLEKGCYLISLFYDGKVYGTQVVYTVK